MSSGDYKFRYAIGDPFMLTGSLPPFRVTSRVLGGFCEVYALESDDPNRPGRVAVKTPRDDSSFGDKDLRAFKEEARLWSNFPPHLSILPCIGVEVVSQKPYAVLKYVDGFDCERFFMFGNAPIGLQLNVLFQVISALSELEKRVQDFSHGDIKPSNILIEVVPSREDADERIAAYLTDFGLSRALSRKSIHVLGDRRYLAPELLGGDLYSWKAADMYSLGATAVQIIFEQPLKRFLDFNGCERPERLLSDANISIHKERGVSASLVAFLSSLVHQDPARRPTTFEQVSDELRDIIEASGTRVTSKMISNLDAANASFITSFRDDPVVRFLIKHLAFSEQEATNLRLEQSEGSRLVKLGNIDSAIIVAGRLIKRYPLLPLGYAILGGAYMEKRDFKRAADSYMQAIQLHDQDTSFKTAHPFGYAEICYSLSQILHNDQRIEGRQVAVTLALRATDLLPSHPIALMALGRAFLSVHEYERGFQILQGAFELFPGESVIRAYLALAKCLLSGNPHGVDTVCAELGLSDNENTYVQSKLEQITNWHRTESIFLGNADSKGET